MATMLDLLSDTVYRDKAIETVDLFVEKHGTPAGSRQIRGLRNLVDRRPSPREIAGFANKQAERAQSDLERLEERKEPSVKQQRRKEELYSYVAFWKLVADLCEDNRLPWSPASEGLLRMPDELRDESIPAKVKGMSHEERGRRNRLLKRQREWLQQWNREHLPAFFQRFCTHYLYRLGEQKSTRE